MNWLYGFRLTNWLMAKPWRWRYRTIYRTLRVEQHHSSGFHSDAHGRVRSAWLALTFPHVHPMEDGNE